MTGRPETLAFQQRNPFDGLAEMFVDGKYNHLTDGQRRRVVGFAKFLNLANLGMQWVDFGKRDKDLKEDLQKKLEARSSVVRALYQILYPQEQVIPQRLLDARRLPVQQTVVAFIDILYPVSGKFAIAPQKLEKMSQLVDFMRVLCDQWVPKQA